MKTMEITKFKAYALKVIDQVAKTNESIVITKRGKPLTALIPFKKTKQRNTPGKLAHTLVFEKDIITPLDSKKQSMTTGTCPKDRSGGDGLFKMT